MTQQMSMTQIPQKKFFEELEKQNVFIEIVQEIALGSYKKVYLCRNKKTNQRLVMKVSQGQGNIDLKNEYQNSQKINFSAYRLVKIDQLFSLQIEGEEACVGISEKVGEKSLRKIIETEEPPNLQSVIQLLFDGLITIQECQICGIQNFDLKPDNIIRINEDFYFIDFSSSQESQIITPFYSPKYYEIEGFKRFDIYSLGITLLQYLRVKFNKIEDQIQIEEVQRDDFKILVNYIKFYMLNDHHYQRQSIQLMLKIFCKMFEFDFTRYQEYLIKIIEECKLTEMQKAIQYIALHIIKNDKQDQNDPYYLLQAERILLGQDQKDPYYLYLTRLEIAEFYFTKNNLNLCQEYLNKVENLEKDEVDKENQLFKVKIWKQQQQQLLMDNYQATINNLDSKIQKTGNQDLLSIHKVKNWCQKQQFMVDKQQAAINNLDSKILKTKQQDQINTEEKLQSQNKKDQFDLTIYDSVIYEGTAEISYDCNNKNFQQCSKPKLDSQQIKLQDKLRLKEQKYEKKLVKIGYSNDCLINSYNFENELTQTLDSNFLISAETDCTEGPNASEEEQIRTKQEFKNKQKNPYVSQSPLTIVKDQTYQSFNKLREKQSNIRIFSSQDLSYKNDASEEGYIQQMRNQQEFKTSKKNPFISQSPQIVVKDQTYQSFNKLRDKQSNIRISSSQEQSYENQASEEGYKEQMRNQQEFKTSKKNPYVSQCQQKIVKDQTYQSFNNLREKQSNIRIFSSQYLNYKNDASEEGYIQQMRNQQEFKTSIKNPYISQSPQIVVKDQTYQSFNKLRDKQLNIRIFSSLDQNYEKDASEEGYVKQMRNQQEIKTSKKYPYVSQSPQIIVKDQTYQSFNKLREKQSNIRILSSQDLSYDNDAQKEGQVKQMRSQQEFKTSKKNPRVYQSPQKIVKDQTFQSFSKFRDEQQNIRIHNSEVQDHENQQQYQIQQCFYRVNYVACLKNGNELYGNIHRTNFQQSFIQSKKNKKKTINLNNYNFNISNQNFSFESEQYQIFYQNQINQDYSDLVSAQNYQSQNIFNENLINCQTFQSYYYDVFFDYSEPPFRKHFLLSEEEQISYYNKR
ncbi:hypothetical protein ABPG72_011693 [Tetrahymena utriculariae]